MVRRASSLTLAGFILTFTASCGGSGTPTTPPTPVATATPAPLPTPTPSPSPACVPGGDCPGNTTPVVRAVLRLYRLFDNVGGWFLPADNQETNGITGDGSGIEWIINDPSLVEFAGDPAGPFQHKYRLLKPGTLNIYVGFDGVGSNDLTFEVVPCTPPDSGCKAGI